MSFYEICLLFALGWISMRITITNNLGPKKFILKSILKLLMIWLLFFSIILTYLLKKELEYEKVVVEMTRDEIFENKQIMDAIYSDFEETQEELRDAYIEIQSLKDIIALNDTEKCHMDNCNKWTCHEYKNSKINNNNQNENDNLKNDNNNNNDNKKNVGDVMFGWMLSSTTTSFFKSFFTSNDDYYNNNNNNNHDNYKNVCPYKSKEDAVKALWRHLNKMQFREIISQRRLKATPRPELTKDQKKILNRLSMLFHPDKLPACDETFLLPAMQYINDIR